MPKLLHLVFSHTATCSLPTPVSLLTFYEPFNFFFIPQYAARFVFPSHQPLSVEDPVLGTSARFVHCNNSRRTEGSSSFIFSWWARHTNGCPYRQQLFSVSAAVCKLSPLLPCKYLLPIFRFFFLFSGKLHTISSSFPTQMLKPWSLLPVKSLTLLAWILGLPWHFYRAHCTWDFQLVI